MTSEKLCDYVYKTCDTHGQQRIRCVPKDGVQLYKIFAFYPYQRCDSTYYVLGTTPRDARDRFRNVFSYMKIRDTQMVRFGSDEAESVLTNQSNTFPIN